MPAISFETLYFHACSLRKRVAQDVLFGMPGYEFVLCRSCAVSRIVPLHKRECIERDWEVFLREICDADEYKMSWW